MAVKRILYVEQNLDGTIGGSHFCLLDLVKYLDREKYEPLVAFYTDNALRNEFERYCPTHILPTYAALEWLTKRPGGGRSVSYAVQFIQKTINLFISYIPSFIRRVAFLRHNRIDLVHLNNSMMKGYDWLVAGKFTGVKCITHNRRGPVVTALRKFFIKRFDTVIYLADFMMDDLHRQGVESNGRFVKINDGIDPAYLLGRMHSNREETRRTLGIAPEQPVIGIVGNIKRWKGQDVVIKAVALLKQRYPDLLCLVIGDTSNIRGDDRVYFDAIETFIDTNHIGDAIRFLGYREDVPDLMGSLDVLINASTLPEPFGHVILEGMALEVPVIATNFGGSPELIEDGVSGILVTPGDETDLAKAVDSLLGDKAFREQIARSGRARIDERFLLTRNIRETEALYEQLFTVT